MSPKPSAYTVLWSPAALLDLDGLEGVIGLTAPVGARQTRNEIIIQGDGLREAPFQTEPVRGSVRLLLIQNRYWLRYCRAGAQVRILGVRDDRSR